MEYNLKNSCKKNGIKMPLSSEKSLGSAKQHVFHHPEPVTVVTDPGETLMAQFENLSFEVFDNGVSANCHCHIETTTFGWKSGIAEGTKVMISFPGAAVEIEMYIYIGCFDKTQVHIFDISLPGKVLDVLFDVGMSFDRQIFHKCT